MKKISSLCMIVGCIVWIYTSIAYADVESVAWIPPNSNEDGSPITELISYKIYCEDGAIEMYVGGVQEYLIKNILGLRPGGMYLCAITTYYDFACDGTHGNDPYTCESLPSNELSIFKKNDSYFSGSEPGLTGTFRLK